MINSKINGTTLGVNLPILKLDSILAVANLLTQKCLWLAMLLWASKFVSYG